MGKWGAWAHRYHLILTTLKISEEAPQVGLGKWMMMVVCGSLSSGT